MRDNPSDIAVGDGQPNSASRGTGPEKALYATTQPVWVTVRQAPIWLNGPLPCGLTARLAPVRIAETSRGRTSASGLTWVAMSSASASAPSEWPISTTPRPSL